MSESTDVEVYEAPAASALEQWGRDLTTAYQMSRQLVTTSFVPDTYNGKPEEAAAAIVTGAELGLTPLASLRSIDIINGVPGMRAIAMRALVQSRGHDIWIDESTATRCVMKGRRKGSDKVETSTWTIERAKALGLLGRKGDNWTKQPIAMLVARATSELARILAADVLLGIPYSIEELEDDAPAEAAPDAAPRRSSTTARRKPLPERAPAAEPPLPSDDVPPAVEGPRSPEDLAAQDLADAEQQRIADEVYAEEARARAAAEFAAGPPEEQPAALIDDEPVVWEPPLEEPS